MPWIDCLCVRQGAKREVANKPNMSNLQDRHGSIITLLQQYLLPDVQPEKRAATKNRCRGHQPVGPSKGVYTHCRHTFTVDSMLS